MVLAGARVYNDGVGINHDTEEKIHQIVNTIKAVSPSSDVSMRFLKSGQVYEGLLWGKANDIPIGVYKRGVSMSHVLENLLKRVRKECVKVCKMSRGHNASRRKTNFNHQADLAMAG
ncbi:MAG: hypothetical protein AAGB31_13250 [Bdellovibrio sp.]